MLRAYFAEVPWELEEAAMGPALVGSGSLLAEFVTEWNMMMAFSILASAPLVVAFVLLQRTSSAA